MQMFESHAHYDDKRFDDDRHELLSGILPNAGICRIVNAGADMDSSRRSIALSEKYDYVYSSVGVHPHEVKSMTENDLLELIKMTEHKKVVAVGEIGLDYYYDFSPREQQIYWFERQLEAATTVRLPVIIHSRDAAKETFDILKKWCGNVTGGANNMSNRRGVIHAYSYSTEMAKEYVKLGFYIGIGGVITFKNAKKLIEAATEIPLERILIETDCPYLSPVPNRGKRNDSQNLSFVVEKIAQIKQISNEEASFVTKENSLHLFSLK